MEKIDNIWTIFSEMSKLMGGGGKPGITQGRGTDTLYSAHEVIVF